MTIRYNIFLALISGLLLGLPWSATSFFFVVFIALVPLLQVEKEIGQHANPYAIFNYAFISCLLWNIIGTWWIIRVQWAGAVFIILTNTLIQAFMFWLASRIRCILKIPFLIPFVFIWMGYEHIHLAWDLAWPWLNLGNAPATAPKLIQWYEFTGVRGGTLWIILGNFAILKLFISCHQRSFAAAGAAGALVLALDVARVDGPTGVLCGGVAQDRDLARLRIDLDVAHLSGETGALTAGVERRAGRDRTAGLVPLAGKRSQRQRPGRGQHRGGERRSRGGPPTESSSRRRCWRKSATPRDAATSRPSGWVAERE